MKILTYKQTHSGDPDLEGTWGRTGCMGKVRNQIFDAVIGVGGSGAMARSKGISRKLTWVGAGRIERRNNGAGGNDIVSFRAFAHWGKNGPNLAELAPSLAQRMYAGKVRHISKAYTEAEHSEAKQIVAWLLSGGRKRVRGKVMRLPLVTGRAAGLETCPPDCPPKQAVRRRRAGC